MIIGGVLGQSLYINPFTLVPTPTAPTPDVAWWKLHNDGVDSTGNGHTGTLNGSPSSAIGQDGISGHALAFNGSNQNITFTNINTGTTFTITLWINFVDFNNTYAGMIGQSGNGGFLHHFNSVPFTEYYDGGNEFSMPDTTVINTWYHLAVVSNANVCQLYITGSTLGSTFTNTNTLNLNYIGSDLVVPRLNNCIMQDVRIYSSALTSGQILSIYNAGAK